MNTTPFHFLVLLALGVAITIPSGADTAAPSVDAVRALGAEVKENGGGVTEVSFKDCSKLGEAEFRLLGQVSGLKKLTLYGQCHGLNDQTLPLLAGLTELEELSTDGVQLSDEGFQHFAPLKNLRSLAFFHPSAKVKSFTGAGLAQLKALPKLERLTFAGTDCGDDALAAIAQLTQLKELGTWHTHQTQTGNAHLLKLTGLKSLWLGQRLRHWDGSPNALSLDDRTLDLITKLPSLESLTLNETRLSLAALSQLRSLPRLKKLRLEVVDVPADDIEKLRAVLPGVSIEWTPLTDKSREQLENMLKP